VYLIAVCDDDPLAIKTISKHLEDLHNHNLPYELTPYRNGEELVRDHERGHRFHLILLDMIMKPMDGITVARHIREYDPLVPILIITSTTEFAVEGYKVNAQRYLLKPIEHEELMQVALPLLEESLNREMRHFSFNVDGKPVRVRLDQILYFESNLKQMSLVTLTERYTFLGTISDIEGRLRSEGFERIHKSFVVNLRYVNRLQAQSLTLDNGLELPVSRHRYKDVLTSFMHACVGR
jgi:DNA-binding LytR/AlgR family response regulator